MSRKEGYEVGEKVYVDHGSIYYEAKILSIDTSKAPKYAIHYQGWNSRYDETIYEDKILKYNDANAKKAKELEAALLAHEKSTPSSKKKRRIGPGLSKAALNDSAADQLSSRTSSPCPSQDGSVRNLKTGATSTDSGGERKRKGRQSTPSQPSTSRAPSAAETAIPPSSVPSTVEAESHYKHTPEIQVKMPEDLKPVLVDDWDLITRQLKLVGLPARISVDDILDEYLKHRKGANGGSLSAAKYSQVNEAIMGVKEYFNAMLGTQLLYKFERQQYADLIQNREGVKHSEIYGAPHLLRLFVRLGHMLAYTSLSEVHVNVILGHVHDFLRYLSKNKARLFCLDDYEVASPEYQRAAFS